MIATDAFWRTRVPSSAKEESSVFRPLQLRSSVRDDVAAVDASFREKAVLGELEGYRKDVVALATNERATLYLQAVTRGWLCRRRYLLHKAQLVNLQKKLRSATEHACASVGQKVVRGWIARRQLKVMQQEADNARDDEKKKGKKQKGGRRAVALPTDLPRVQRLVRYDAAFLEGWTHFAVATGPTFKSAGNAARLNDAIKVWEKHKGGHDKVLLRTLDRCYRLRDQRPPSAEQAGKRR
ncbi:hypothetical protein DIPPA_25874 [Diplonema papillatum]|nr:hypothetical protein DIPPA_25874 [Diplonema papillatum]